MFKCFVLFDFSDALSGNLRVWNVSKSTPVENIRVKKTGFHAFTIICDRQATLSQYSNTSSSNQTSSTSLAQNPTAVNSANFALPPARVVCTFLDGGVGLYDLGRRKWDFLKEQVGHNVSRSFHFTYIDNEGSYTFYLMLKNKILN